MYPSNLPNMITQLMDAWMNGPLHTRQAVGCIAEGHYQIITGRRDDEPYLLRLWVTAPLPGPDGKFDSGSSELLHWFPRGDDDEALHDHPWDFRTEILDGGYVEHLPPMHYQHDSLEGPGPAFDQFTISRFPGTIISHAAEDLHCVGRLLAPITTGGLGGGCWTRVRTGERRREWGFHPPGQPWQPWRQFLGLESASVAP